MNGQSKHVPPLRFHALTGAYDAVLAFTTRELRFKRSLLDQIKMPPSGTLLDLGCGTGTMTLWVRADWPEAHIIGVDADDRALEIARGKQSAAGVDIDFRRADARALPLDDSSVDVLICSLFFHHLNDEVKKAALDEAFRVLQPEGRLLVADWGRPGSILTSLGFFLVRCLDGFEPTRANAAGELPGMIEHAGFTELVEFDRVTTVFGEIQLVSAVAERVS